MTTYDDIRKELAYDPETGEITWLISKRGLRKGSAAGSPNSEGYRRVTCQGKAYYSHQLAFILQGLPVPSSVDHINGNPRDNRWSNLRACTHSENQGNTTGRSKSGHKNIHKRGNCFQVVFKFEYKRYSYWTKTLEEAINWRDKKLAEVYGEFANTSHKQDTA